MIIDTNKKSGIYCIENKINGKKYIGKYIGVIKYRISDHISKLNKKKHHNKYLQRAWDKYGKENFNFYVIGIFDKENLNNKEKYYIRKFKTKNIKYGYNLTDGGDGGNANKGRKFSDSHRKNISKSKSGKTISKDNPFFGKKHSEETKLIISNKAKLRYKNLSKKEKKIMEGRLTNRGKSFWTDETYKKLKKYGSEKRILFSKVSEKQAIGILKSNLPYKKISKKYNISMATISRIKNGKRWSNLKERFPELYG